MNDVVIIQNDRLRINFSKINNAQSHRNLLHAFFIHLTRLFTLSRTFYYNYIIYIRHSQRSNKFLTYTFT